MQTLGQFIIEKQADFPFAKGELSRLLRDIGIAAKIVSREVNKAGLMNIYGESGSVNVQGEKQQKLDVFANAHFISALSGGGECAAVASEEAAELIVIAGSEKAKYVVCIDPLDGSANIDVNVGVGTIFSIYRRLDLSVEVGVADVLQQGSSQVAAGYVVYGSSTMLVYTTGKGVNGFTLDPSIGEFCLSHPGMRIPASGSIYSINEGNYVHFPDGVKRFIKFAQQEDVSSGRPYTSRYIGSMVADVHRNLILGGIYLYPSTSAYPEGKLRLLYECNPMAMLIEQAGGKATDGFRRILEIQPRDIHQRCPIFCGSAEMVKKAELLMHWHSPEYNPHSSEGLSLKQQVV